MDGKLIGERLKKLRGNLTQDLVAEKTGISKSALSMYERGERIPRDEIKIRLAKFYETPVQKLFFDREEQSQTERRNV